MAVNDGHQKAADLRLSLEYVWQVSKYVDLPRTFSSPVADIFELLERRRSRRTFKKLNVEALSSVLWFAQRHTGTFLEQHGRVSTPIPTFGGLASVRTLVITPDFGAWIYDPELHRAGLIDADETLTKNIRVDVNKFFDLNEGSLLIFAASREYVAPFYEQPESLVLRESGILTANLALIAEAFDFSFCPLGTSAKEWLLPLLNATEEIVISAGAAVIGGR